MGVIVSYLMIYVVWGSTYLFIKYAVVEIPPFLLVGIRFFMGGLLLLPLVWKKGHLKSLTKKQLFNSILTGILLLLGGNGLVSLAQTRVDSYIAALVIASTPVAVLIYDRFLFRKRVAITGWFGALLGISGVACLFFRDGHHLSISPFALFLLIAVGCWALGTSLSKVLTLPANSMANTAIQQAFAGCIALSAFLFINPSDLVSWTHSSPRALFSIFYLGIVGSITLVAYAYLLYNEPNHRIVTYAFVNPLIAVFLGLFIAHEHPVRYIVPGTILILGGLALTFYGEKFLIGFKRMRRSKLRLK